jgi:hypothetical protein
MFQYTKINIRAVRAPALASIVIVLLCACGPGRLDAQSADVKAVRPIPFADGVIDADLRIAYVSSPQGGIQAIRLEDGKVLWTNDTAKGQPWLVAGSRLIARGERLLIVDLKSEGKVVRPADVPAYPKVAAPDRCTVSFNLWGPRVVGGTLEANWYAVANIDRSKGRPFAFQAWTAFNKAAPVGTVKINLDTGKAEVLADPKTADVTGGLIPEAAKAEKQMPPGLPPMLTAAWQQYFKDQDGRITLVGDRLVAVSMTLEKQGGEYSKRITLHAWNAKTGMAAAPVELVKDKALNIANVMITEDRRHAGVAYGNFTLTIYSLNDGKPVGTVKGVSSPERAFVTGKRLYFAQQTGARGAPASNLLKVIDLENGNMIWERPLQPRSNIPLPP